MFHVPVLNQCRIVLDARTPMADRYVTGIIGYSPNRMTEIENTKIPIEIRKSLLKRLK